MALNKCCFCVPLRSGTLFIGILYLVVNCCTLLAWTSVTIAAASSENAHYRRIDMLFVYILLALLGVCGMNIAMDSLLVHGVRKNQRKFIMPWVIWYGKFTAPATLTWLGVNIWMLYSLIHYEARDGMGALIAFFCISVACGLIYFATMWFWYACVTSFFILLAPSDSYVMELLRAPKTERAQVLQAAYSALRYSVALLGAQQYHHGRSVPGTLLSLATVCYAR